jgi:carbon storage regulator
MLVLTRGISQEIVIGDDVVVTIVSVQGNKVRLGITAPREVPVHRRELRQPVERAGEPDAAPARS